MVIWVIGLSGSGKTTLCDEVYLKTHMKSEKLVKLDGDVIREIFGNDLGHSIEDRRKNAKRISGLCKFLDDQNINVICSILSVFEEHREWNRKNISNYYEVFVNVEREKLIERDSKGLYKKYLDGEIKNVAGFDLTFETPKSSNLIIYNNSSKEEFLNNAKTITNILLENV